MNSAPPTTKTSLDGIRIALGIGGLLALAVGIVILVWPDKTAMVVAAIIAIYAIVTGLVYAGIGGLSKVRSGWSRLGHVLLGIIFIIAGIVALSNLGQTAVWLGWFLGVLVAVMWIVEGVVALSTLSDAGSKVWSIFFAAISILAGVLLLFAPLWGAMVLWMLMGISLIVLGVINVVRAIAFGRKNG